MKSKYPMRLLTIALVLLWSAAAWANSDLYIVVLDGAKSGKADLSDEEVAKLGGRVEYRARGQVVVRAPAAAVEALRTDPRVKYVQQAILGRPSESGAAEAPASVVRMGRRSLQPAPQGAPPVWMSGTYKYDGAGNIYAIGVTADGAGVTPHTYRYDKLSRLSEVRNSAGGGNADESFGYDVYGNMTQHVEGNVTTVIDVDAATNRLSRPWLNPNPYQYDAAGDLSAEPNAAYTYDALGMLRERDYGTQWPDYYIYTADDERIATVYQDTWTWSVRGFDGAVLRQFQSQTNSSVPWLWLEDYVYRGGLLVSGERMREEGGRREFHLDHLGTPRLVTGPGGAEMAHHDLEPYGTEAYPLWQETTAGFDREDPMRFTGHERDFRSGFLQTTTPYLDYMHARYYASTVGRFASPDKVGGKPGHPQTWNRFAYSGDNPLKYVDPSGEYFVLINERDRAFFSAAIAKGTRHENARDLFLQLARDKTHRYELSTGPLSGAKGTIEVGETRIHPFMGAASPTGSRTTIDASKYGTPGTPSFYTPTVSVYHEFWHIWDEIYNGGQLLSKYGDTTTASGDQISVFDSLGYRADTLTDDAANALTEDQVSSYLESSFGTEWSIADYLPSRGGSLEPFFSGPFWIEGILVDWSQTGGRH